MYKFNYMNPTEATEMLKAKKILSVISNKCQTIFEFEDASILMIYASDGQIKYGYDHSNVIPVQPDPEKYASDILARKIL